MEESQLEQMQKQIREFCTERDWDQFHSLKDLAIGLTVESSELLELFRFKSDEECRSMLTEDSRRQKVEEELADVLFFLLRISDLYKINLVEAFAAKMKRNSAKYPVHLAKGSNKKYTDLA